MKNLGKILLVVIVMFSMTGATFAAPRVAGSRIQVPPWAQRFAYEIVFDQADPNTVSLVVRNVYRKHTEVMFPTSKTHDIVIKQDGKVVFRASDDMMYLEAITYDTFAPMEKKTYETMIPALSPGAYSVEAYFVGARQNQKPVARIGIVIPVRNLSPVRSLRYHLEHDRENPSKVKLVVKNPSNSPVEVVFPSTKTHDIVLKSNGQVIWRESEGMVYGMALVMGTIAPGETKVYETTLPELRDGRYQVEAYFMAAQDSSKPVATSTMSVATKKLEPSQVDGRFNFRFSFDPANP